MSSQDYAPRKKISSFYPPQRHLMGPGPSEIHPRVFSAMGKPTIGYLDPVFVEMMEELKESLRYALLAFCPGYLWAAWHLWRASRTVSQDLA